jgi:hypothetical protein
MIDLAAGLRDGKPQFVDSNRIIATGWRQVSLPWLISERTAFPARDPTIFLATAAILLAMLATGSSFLSLSKGLNLPSEPAAQRE